MALRASCPCQGVALEVDGAVRDLLFCHCSMCPVCGSNLFTRFDARPQELGLALGILDDDPGSRPTRHLFVGSKAPWYEKRVGAP